MIFKQIVDNFSDMNTFGDRLKQAREKIGISQKELAIRCGWTEGSNISSRISQYERNEREPTLGDILLLAKALETSEEWLAFKKQISFANKALFVCEGHTEYQFIINKLEVDVK